MSVMNVKSTVIRNRDASGPILSNPEVAQGLAKVALGVNNTGHFGTDLSEAGGAIRLITVPSNARLQSLEYAMGDLGTSGLDITVWYPTSIPQGATNAPAASSAAAVISSSTFINNIAGVDTSIAWTNAFGTNATPTITRYVRPLWDMVGLATDPKIDLDLGFTIRTVVVQNGYVGLRAVYVD